MWPQLQLLMSRPSDSRDSHAVVITEIAVTVAIVVAAITAIAAQATESHKELLQTVR